MGFESYQLSLRSDRATAFKAKELIRKLPNVKADPNGGMLSDGDYYVMNDGKHVIELELTDSPFRISCRFTLCHPPSIDAAFLGFVRKLMAALELDIEIRELGYSRPFSVGEFDEWAQVVARGIAEERELWIAEMGTEQLIAASSKDVYEKIIIPRCRPVETV